MPPRGTKRGSTPSEHDGSRKKNNIKGLDFSNAKDMVKFLVGPKGAQEKFLIHKSVVYHHSAMLKAAVEEELKDGVNQDYTIEVTTEGSTPGAFRMVMQFMYNQEIQIPILDSETGHDQIPEVFPQTIRELVDLWLLGAKFLLPKLQNVALYHIHTVSQKFEMFYNGVLFRVYEETSKESALRKYFIASVACELSGNAFRSSDNYPVEFLLDLARYHAFRREENPEQYSFNFKDFYVPTPLNE